MEPLGGIGFGMCEVTGFERLRAYLSHVDPKEPRNRGMGSALVTHPTGLKNFEMMLELYLRRGHDVCFWTDLSRDPGFDPTTVILHGRE